MKKLHLFLFIVLYVSVSFSQTGSIIWAKNFGGSGNDTWPSVLQDNDSNIVSVTWSNSNNGYVNTNYGNYDILCIKTNRNGDTIFSKNFGSYADDSPKKIINATDGGYLIAANTNDSNKVKGGYDIWLIKIDTNGDTLWTKTYGGSNDDFVYNINKTNDNNYILSIGSKSNDGDFNTNNGGYDAWFVKINTSGNIIWKKHYGGSLNDISHSLTNTSDGYIFNVKSKSSDGDFNINYGESDITLIKFDIQDSIQWTKHIGGSNYDNIIKIIELENNYYLFGNTYSNDSDITNNHGAWDFLVIKLNNAGNILWQKCYGGSLNDVSRSAILVNNTFFIAGGSKSSDGDVANNKGENDIWILNIDTAGTILWQKNYGGTYDEEATKIIETLDGNLLFSAYTESYNDDISGNLGSSDLWLVKLSTSTTTNITDLKPTGVSIYPNPTSGIFNISSSDKIDNIQIFNSLGAKIIETKNTQINISNYNKGVYVIKIKTKNTLITKKLILN